MILLALYTRSRKLIAPSVALAIALCSIQGAQADPDTLSLGVRPEGAVNAVFDKAVEIPLAAAAENRFTLHTAATNWVTLDKLRLAFSLQADAPTNIQVLAHAVDWDGMWHQSLVSDFLAPGATNIVEIDISAEARDWEPRGHSGAWNRRSLLEPREVGVKLLGGGDYAGECAVLSAQGVRGAPQGPPVISRIRANTAAPAVRGLYELRFELSDRYANPFDPDEIAVDAEIEQPDGSPLSVPAFYFQDYYRVVDAAGERILPQGRPEWRLRFAPRMEGVHRVRLKAKDRLGTGEWDAGDFAATAAEHPGVVRVSKIDSRFLEHEDGTPFFPIGINIRSPFDTRMDDQFPWSFRHPEGSAVYERYFEKLQAAGANIVEIWASAWCLGLEWSPTQQGYHGIGQYNLIHAWERDRVFRMAERTGLYINLVLNNHGRVGSYLDPEWKDNPHNAARGGYIKHPMEWFADERAIRSYEKQVRYEVARYGWSPNLFAWELWSELDLTGSGHKDKPHHAPSVLAWHKRIGGLLGELDVWGHMISTHVSGDYKVQNPELIKLPELDMAAVDAYHHSRSPLQIADLQRQTAEFNAPLGKPVLITEFGGSPMAADLRHLRLEAHAALWSSVATGVAGAPLFWWWQVVEEENYYPMYRALSRFMEGEDRRDPALVHSAPEIVDSDGGRVKRENLGCLALASPEKGWGWIFAGRNHFPWRDPEGRADFAGYKIILGGEEGEIYRIEFWSTLGGEIVEALDVRATGGVAVAPVPAFARDLAFKFRRAGAD